MKRRLAEKVAAIPHRTTVPAPIRSVIDIEGNEKISSSPGYKQWAAIFNLKQRSASLNLIQQYGGMDAFMELYKECIGMKITLSRDINGIDAEIKALSKVRDNLRAFGRTKDVYKQYRSLNEKQRSRFYRDHKAEIDTHIVAKKELSKVKPSIPTAKAITSKIEQLKVTKADTYVRYRQNEVKLKEMDITRKNLESLIRQHEPKHQKIHELSR